jgi:Flp pilus assembly protein TadG
MFKQFLHNVRGNFAVMTAVLAVPLLLSVGLYIDYARQSSAHSHVQALADIAALEMAGTRSSDLDILRATAKKAIAANMDPNTVQHLEIASLTLSGQQIAISLKGKIDTTFLRLASTEQAGVQAHATAERAVNGSVEVALILDNTYSMIKVDDSGRKKIESLKLAALDLVTRLLDSSPNQIKISLVPYADYVNVGTQYRNASWLTIPDEYTTPATGGVCTEYTTKDECEAWNPSWPCTTLVDNVEVPYTCGGGCANWIQVPTEPYTKCTPVYGPYEIKWHGCVGSRLDGDSRLNDESPSIKYPGRIAYHQECPTPITPLTNSRTTLTDAIAAMKYGTAYYFPKTYIPAGLIWGLNVLSRKQPFDEGRAYDINNIAPRKVAVLMTDGDNTLRFSNLSGNHVEFTRGSEALERQQPDGDTIAICNEMKAKKIEIFSVAFLVWDAQAQSVLEACASDSQHYFNADDSSKLLGAFQQIADSLKQVRLVR